MFTGNIGNILVDGCHTSAAKQTTIFSSLLVDYLQKSISDKRIFGHLCLHMCALTCYAQLLCVVSLSTRTPDGDFSFISNYAVLSVFCLGTSY